MKRPRVVTASIAAHLVLGSWMIISSTLIVQRVSWGFVAFVSILLPLHLLGLSGLMFRYAWARRYSIIVFGIYALFNISAFARAIKPINSESFSPGMRIISIIYSGAFSAATIWLAHGLMEKDVKEYLAAKRPAQE